MDFKKTLKKGIENILVTIPVWGTAGAIATEVLMNPTPTVVRVEGHEYAIFRYDDRTLVRTGMFSNIDMIDMNNDGTVDVYRETMGCRHGMMIYTLEGKRIPTDIQDKYIKVINSSKE